MKYSQSAAGHYDAYRPPLHSLILEQALGQERFERGLDVGCGTGRSAVALREYARSILAIDPSQAMLDRASAGEGVTYRCTGLEELRDESFDIVTFAGSLYYAQSPKLGTMLSALCRPNAVVVVYDFEVELEPILCELGVAVPRVSGNYDHNANLGQFATFEELVTTSNRVVFQVAPEQLIHLLLANEKRSDILLDRWGTQENILGQLNKVEQKLAAQTFMFKYISRNL